MTEKSSRKQRKATAGSFKPGRSGNPKGKPKGCVSLANRMVREVFETKSADVAHVVLSAALGGDLQAAAVVLDRICPKPKFPPRPAYDLPALDTVEDCVVAMKQVARDVAAGTLDEDHGAAIAARLNDAAKLAVPLDLIARMEQIETRLSSL